MAKNYTILAIDDDPTILKVLKRFIELECGYSVTTTSSLQEALDFVKNNHVDIILSDYHMGTFTGFDFFRELDKLGNKTVRILITGTPDNALNAQVIPHLNIFKIIFKPWDNDEFKRILQSALGEPFSV